MQAEPKRQFTYRDLMSWNVINKIESEAVNGYILTERLYDIDPVKSQGVSMVIGRLINAGAIAKGSSRIKIVNPLLLAVLKAKIENGPVDAGQSIVHDTRGIWGD